MKTMRDSRIYKPVLDRLRSAGLRPTRQRLALAKILFENGDRHVTAEQLHGETLKEGVRVSLATVYNTLHQFTDAGLLKEIVVDSGRSYFDTNTSDHFHFFCEDTGDLVDFPAENVTIKDLPNLPDGTELGGVDLVVRVRQSR